MSRTESGTSEALSHKGNGVASSRCHFAQASLHCPTTTLLDGSRGAHAQHLGHAPASALARRSARATRLGCRRKYGGVAFPVRRPPTMGAPAVWPRWVPSERRADEARPSRSIPGPGAPSEISRPPAAHWGRGQTRYDHSRGFADVTQVWVGGRNLSSIMHVQERVRD